MFQLFPESTNLGVRSVVLLLLKEYQHVGYFLNIQPSNEEHPQLLHVIHDNTIQVPGGFPSQSFVRVGYLLSV